MPAAEFFLPKIVGDGEGGFIVHLIREGSAKTLCRKVFTVHVAGDAPVLDQPFRMCAACLSVLKVDWLLEDATARK